MTSELEDLIHEIEDPELRAQILGKLHEVRQPWAFGFDGRVYETVDMPGRPVHVGARVRPLGVTKSPTYLVTSIEEGQATVVPLSVPGELPSQAEQTPPAAQTVPVADIVVVIDLDETVYPGLRLLGTVGRGGDKSSHIVINAESHHALEALQFTHAGKVDCIYIDAPTSANEFMFSGRQVPADDPLRHPKWTSFVARRLRLARHLMTPTGIIIAAVDDANHAYLKMVMDREFGESNFIANVVWDSARKNWSHYVSSGHDHMLLYARSASSMAETDWKEPKPGLNEALDIAKKIWTEAKGENKHETAEKRWREAVRRLKASGVIGESIARFNKLDPSGIPACFDVDLSCTKGNGPRYDVLHPVTQKPVRVPTRGWGVKDPAAMQEMVAAGRVKFGKTEKNGIRGIKLLTDSDSMPVTSVFVHNRHLATKAVKTILGEERYRGPRDTDVLARWIRLATAAKPDAVILDFFGGSGSTTQAVMEMNEADGGRRQSILVTYNEPDASKTGRLAKQGLKRGDSEWERWGLFEYVARPRIEAVATGVRADGSVYSDGMEQNVGFFELTYRDHQLIELDMDFDSLAPLLWMRAGGRGPILTETFDSNGSRAPYGWTDHYAVLFKPNARRSLLAKMPDSVKAVFVLSDSASEFARVAAEAPAGVELVRLYDSYLTTLQNSKDHL